MDTEIYNSDAERALVLIDQTALPDDALDENNALRLLYYGGYPRITPGIWYGAFFVVAYVGIAAGYIISWGPMERGLNPAFDLPILLLMAAGSTLVWYSSLLFLERLNATVLIRRLYPAMTEVHALNSFLATYLLQLDQRTRSYFHLMTNTKVMNYYVLMQIKEGLEIRTGHLAELIMDGSPRAALTLFELLTTDLSLRSSVLSNSGSLYKLPLRRARRAIEVLVRDLEANLGNLEREIGRPGASTRSSPSTERGDVRPFPPRAR